MDELITWLMHIEGDERYAYNDSLGFITIGIGRCIDRRKGKGISPQESLYLLQNDIDDCKAELASLPFYIIQDDVRKCVLIELCFNLGLTGLLSFKKMIGALLDKNYKLACSELLDSKWATQISNERINNICYRLENGEYP